MKASGLLEVSIGSGFLEDAQCLILHYSFSSGRNPRRFAQNSLEIAKFPVIYFLQYKEMTILQFFV